MNDKLFWQLLELIPLQNSLKKALFNKIEWMAFCCQILGSPPTQAEQDSVSYLVATLIVQLAFN